MVIRQIFTLAIYVILEALRTRFFVVIAILLLVGFGLALFIGQVAIIESQAMQSSLLAAFLRLSAVYVVSLFVIASMVREFSDRSIYLWLSFPLHRSVYLFGKLGGFTLVALITAFLFGTVLLGYVPYIQVGLWVFSLFCELLIITALSLLCVLTFHQTVQAFSVVLGFYILARSINAMQLMVQGPLLTHSFSWVDYLVSELVRWLAMLLPNLEQFTQSAWLVYHTGNLDNFLYVFLQTIIYLTLLLSTSLFDFYRKNL